MSQFIILIALLISAIDALKPESISIRLEGHKKRCYIEELLKGTVLLVEFDSSLHNSLTHQKLDAPSYQILTTVEEPSGYVITRQNLKPSSRLFVTAAVNGDHLICFQTLLGQYMPNVYTSLWAEVYLGQDGDSRITSPVEAHLHEFSYALEKSGDLVDEVKREQALQNQRETQFRDLSESLCSMVFYVTLTQTSLVLLAAFLQAWTLRGFFRSKKLV